MVGRTLEKGWTGTLRAEAGRLLAPVVGKVRKKLQCAEHNKAAIRKNKQYGNMCILPSRARMNA